MQIVNDEQGLEELLLLPCARICVGDATILIEISEAKAHRITVFGR
jgi:hypothetical protein